MGRRRRRQATLGTVGFQEGGGYRAVSLTETVFTSTTYGSALLPVSLSWMKAGGRVSSMESVVFGDFPQKSAPPQPPVIESAAVGLSLLLLQEETLTSEERVNESLRSALRTSYLLYT